MVVCLELVQICIWPSWCHCHSLSLASAKSRLVLPFWYQLIRVVPEKRPLNVCVCLETPLGCHFAFAVCILLVRFLAKFCRQSSLKLNAGARWSQRWLSTVCCLWMTCRVGAFFFIVMNYVFSNMSAVDIFIKERAVFMWAGKLSRHNFAAHSRCQDKPFIGFWQTRTHTLHTHPFNGTTRVSRYQKGKTSLDFNENRDGVLGRQWHQLDHMQTIMSIRPVKTEWWGAGVVICLERGADLHTTHLMPLPPTVSCSNKIQIGFTFLVRLTWVVLDKGPLSGCMYVCM